MIIARFIFSLCLFILTCLSFPSGAIAAADCTTTSGAACPIGQTYKCTFNNKGGTTIKACCKDSAACSQYKLEMNAGGKIGTTINPEATCTNGVNTALGCLPYQTDNFVATFLGFLAGVVGLIALFVMLTATVVIMTGGANPEQVKKGKELFTAGITGLLFIIFSVVILRIVAGDIIKLPGFD